MTTGGWWAVAWLLAAALHAGFQLTVTLVVYPAFRRVPNAAWSGFHDGHSRGIAPLVGVLYAGLLAAAAGALVVGLALATTALVAAPTHGRLAGGPEPVLLRRLLRADLVRTVGALVGVAGALLHLLGPA